MVKASHPAKRSGTAVQIFFRYLAERRRPAAEELLHAGELLRGFALQGSVWEPAAGQSLHGGAVGDGRAVQRRHT